MRSDVAGKCGYFISRHEVLLEHFGEDLNGGFKLFRDDFIGTNAEVGLNLIKVARTHNQVGGAVHCPCVGNDFPGFLGR